MAAVGRFEVLLFFKFVIYFCLLSFFYRSYNLLIMDLHNFLSYFFFYQQLLSLFCYHFTQTRLVGYSLFYPEFSWLHHVMCVVNSPSPFPHHVTHTFHLTLSDFISFLVASLLLKSNSLFRMSAHSILTLATSNPI